MKCSYQRIVFYVTDVDPSRGGMERVTYNLSRELNIRGYDVYAIHNNNLPADKRLYSHYKGLCQGDAICPEHITGIIDFITNNHIEIFLNQVSASHTSVLLQKAIKEETSAILVNAFHTSPLFLNSLKVFHRPLPIPSFLNRFLFCIHKAVNLKPLYHKGNRLSYELCDAFVMLSTHYFSEFTKDNKINDFRKLYAIANPSTIAQNDSVEKEKIVLIVARLNNQEKRIDRALRFWKQFHKEGDGWKLMIVGDGPDKGMLSRMAEELNLADYSFEGHSSTPIDYYSQAKIFLMTSDIEGFAMTLIESMSEGCVPIAMNCFSALPDIVTDKQNGMIVAKNDISGMVTAAEYIISNFEKMSATARESVKRFDIESITDKWEELFNHLSR